MIFRLRGVVRDRQCFAGGTGPLLWREVPVGPTDGMLLNFPPEALLNAIGFDGHMGGGDLFSPGESLGLIMFRDALCSASVSSLRWISVPVAIPLPRFWEPSKSDPLQGGKTMFLPYLRRQQCEICVC